VSTKGEAVGKSAYEVAKSSARETFHVYIFEQIAMGHLSTIENLLNGRVPIDLCDGSPSQDTLLHWACSFDQYPVAELLLKKHHLNVDTPNAQGQTCLHVACKAGKNDFIDLLLDCGANAFLKDSSGKTPLDLVPSTLPVNQRLLSNNPNQIVTGHVPTIDVSLSGDTSSHQAEESILGIESDAESGYDTDTSNAIHSLRHLTAKLNHEVACASTKQLILWPPVQRQIQYSSTDNQQSSLILSNESPVIICATSDDIDIYPLLTWSGLIDTLNNLGLQSYVHRSTSAGKIRLTIDPIICPGRHRFEITISKLPPLSLLLTFVFPFHRLRRSSAYGL
jgi:hypothetical protein